jgi:hypothetical protein
VIAIEWELVGDATELGIRWHKYRRDVSLEATHTPGTKEFYGAETDCAGDTKFTDVGQSLMAIEVCSVNTEREFSRWKRLGGWYKPKPGVAEVSR